MIPNRKRTFFSNFLKCNIPKKEDVTFLQKFINILWLSVLSIPLAVIYSNYYAFQDNSFLFLDVSFYSAAIGLFFLLIFLYNLITILPVWLFSKSIGYLRIAYASLILAIAFIVLSVDAHTFHLYRFHLSIAMMDLFWHGGSEILEVSADMMLSIVLEIIGIVIYSVAVVLFSIYLTNKKVKVRKYAILATLLYVFANGVNCYAKAVNNHSLMELSGRLPFYYPLSVNRALRKYGIISEEDIRNREIKQSSNGTFNYPLHELKYKALPNEDELPNILIIAVDSLRYDMLDSETMPNTFEYAKDAWQFNNYFSGGNCTRDGVFSLFYGLPTTYWLQARNSGIPAAMLSVLRERKYLIETFASASLYTPAFNETVFTTFNNLRFRSRGNDAVQRDEACIEDFEKMLQKRNSQKFFSFIFFDNVHGFNLPKDAPHPFKPYNPSVNYLDLKNDSDPTEFLNLYKNAVHYADSNIKKVLDLLDKYDIDDNTIVIITADHGQEFNENKLNFWGHNGNFTKYQTQVPLIIKWPGKGSKVVEEIAVSYDISTTIMQDVLGVENPTEDYSVGQNLFELKPRPFFLSSSYLETGIIEKDRIILIDCLNTLHFKDLNYRDSSNTKRDKNIFDALMLMNKYTKGS